MSFPASPTITRRTFVLTRTRPFSNSALSALRKRLSGQMGSESASLELKWMREELRTRRSAVASSPSFKGNDLKRETEELEKMVERRLLGEPLQYILGECGTVIPPGLIFGTSTDCIVVAGDWL
jgi:methylase of polypeptide subunit release factors